MPPSDETAAHEQSSHPRDKSHDDKTNDGTSICLSGAEKAEETAAAASADIPATNRRRGRASLLLLDARDKGCELGEAVSALTRSASQRTNMDNAW